MKYSECIQNDIKDFSNMGFSGRKIAKMLDLSKSGVNDYLRTLIENDRTQIENVKGPRILFYDLEVAGDTGLFFGRFKINISQDAIVNKGGFILCASWKYEGDSDVSTIFLTPEEVVAGDDSRIVSKLRNLYAQSNAVLCHNSKGYDHKVLQARSAYWSMPALPTVKVLDTLELSRRNLRLPSNKLGSIAAYFDLPLKLETSGISLWASVQAGDKEAMKNMVEYCKQDVVVLEKVWHKLKQVGKAGTDFNAALYYEDDKVRCKVCGSHDLVATGRTVYTGASAYDEIICNSCGSVARSKGNKLTKEKRKSLLV